jgi:hypothetical protein
VRIIAAISKRNAVWMNCPDWNAATDRAPNPIEKTA